MVTGQVESKVNTSVMATVEGLKNGKGSVCSHSAALLVQAIYSIQKYTVELPSPGTNTCRALALSQCLANIAWEHALSEAAHSPLAEYKSFFSNL